MRILILTQYFPPEIGAAQARLEFYARHFSSKGAKVVVLTTAPNYPRGMVLSGYRNRFFHSETMFRCQVIRTWAWLGEIHGFLSRLKIFLSFMISAFFVGLFLKRPNVIVVENPPLFSAVTGLLLARLRRAKLVIHVSDLWVEAAVNFGFLKKGSLVARLSQALEKWVLRGADLNVTVTEGVDAYVKAKAPRVPTAFIPNGVDTALFRPAESPVGKTEEPARVVYAGTMGFQHGLEVIVEAASLLQERRVPVHFELIGEGSARASAEELAKRLGLKNTSFINLLPQLELAERLKFATIGVSTLKNAAFAEGVRPVKLFTYMACGLPVISTDIGESSRIVRDSGCGVLVAPEDPGALADAIECLLSNAELRSRQGRSGREFAEQHFSRLSQAERLLDSLIGVSGMSESLI